jgi:preprotein translocase subunit SecG
MYWFLAWTSQVILLLLGLFLMIIVLLQRGRGGGLAGAFGGMGGQSAFGTKAGDVFTKITIVVALLWVITAGVSGYALRAAAEQTGRQFGEDQSAETPTDPEVPTSPASGNVPAKPTPPAGTATDGTDDATAPATDAATTPATDAAAPVSEPAADVPADPAAGDTATPPGNDQQQN